jgi:M6 family metalloprotease-like protein
MPPIPPRLKIKINRKKIRVLRRRPVSIKIPPKPLYVGTYVRVPISIRNTSGLTMADLDFSIPAGRCGGQISLSRDITYNPAAPEIMLLGGYRPGAYTLRCTNRATAALLDEVRFEITDQWLNDLAGPNLWFNGILPGYAPEPTWGGGSATDPQNFNTIPATGTRQVAILMVDTSDQRYSTTAATFNGFVNRWNQNAFTGEVGADGVTRSVALYYQEVSYNNLTIAGQVFNQTVHLPGVWTDYFEQQPNGVWAPRGELCNQAIINAGVTLNLTGFNMIVIVTQSVPASGATAARIAWPYGGMGINVDTDNGRVTSRGVSMPNEWGDGSTFDQGGGRTIFETLCHELGHTINLPDEYQPDTPGRMLAGVPLAGSSWDMMESEDPLPHFTLVHRMKLGWIDRAWLRLYNFRSLGTSVDETVDLSPVESGSPPAGRSIGIEVRIGDGRNYYIEYRTGQIAHIGDRQLAPNAVLVGVDTSTPPDPPVISRPECLLLPTHADDNGAVLTAGQFYHEIDNSTPTFPSDFRIDVTNINASRASVRIRYGVIGKPDPSIRPWPRDNDHAWQSPDIEVSNARSAADPVQWANVPWMNHANTITAKITNRGTLNAPAVVANFYVKDYTISDSPETFLGFQRKDIAPNATVDFTCPWTPAPPAGSTQAHYCVVVRIEPYDAPTIPPVHEMTDANNVAQSNYDHFISATASPGTRGITAVSVHNPFPRPTRFFIRAGQTNPLFRTYTEHTWLVLDADEQRQVGLMCEYAPEAEQSDPKWKAGRGEKFIPIPNRVTMLGLIENPLDMRLHGPTPVTGVQLDVTHGKATRFDKFEAGEHAAQGQVVETATGKGVPGGSVIIILLAPAGKEEQYIKAKIKTDGSFSARWEPVWTRLQVYYVPAPGYADCNSDMFKKRISKPSV